MMANRSISCLRVLGIETSCDETSAAIVEHTSHITGLTTGSEAKPTPVEDSFSGIIRSNIVLSQIEEHRAFGGVVPEIAARAHVDALDGVVAAALQDADLDLSDLDGIAVTAGPGLIGGVIVGVMTAKALAFGADKPLIAVNHLEGHALTARLTNGVAFPYLLLLVSGGHTQILLVKGLGEYERWGTTIDDAIGEAFDKSAKLLDLGFPGGPAVERHADGGNPSGFDLPRPLLNRPGLDMSFAGLKTAVRLAAQKASPLSPQAVSDLCASFQAAIGDVLANRVDRAIARFKDQYPEDFPTVVVAGGVAANQAIKSRLTALTDTAGARLVVPPPALCTDNGAMIAWAGAERLARGQNDGLDFSPRSRWPLDEQANPALGHGKHGVKV